MPDVQSIRRLVVETSLRSNNETALVGDVYFGAKRDDGRAAPWVALSVVASPNDNESIVGVTLYDRPPTESGAVVVRGSYRVELWFSSSSAGAGLTSATYSGTLVANSGLGTILQTVVAKKHFVVLTNGQGQFEGTLTDTAESTGQYLAVAHPLTGRVVVSSELPWGAV